MESGQAVTAVAPVVCAGVGARHEGRWVLRMTSFRLEPSDIGGASLGVLTPRSPAAGALLGLLSGRIAPGYGYLRVLGHDMTQAAGRAAVRRWSGIASRASRPMPPIRVRTLVERAARRSGQPPEARFLLVPPTPARPARPPGADGPIAAPPDLIARRARPPAACFH